MLFIPLATLGLLISCGNNSETENNSDTAKEGAMQMEGSKDSTESTTVYSLPAPMQIASAIQRNVPTYYDELLCPIKNGPTSDFGKTLNLGIYAVDLGYANVYDQKQKSITYFVASIKLADELKIMGPADPRTLRAFKENIDNKDSVNHYTLGSFGNIHDNLINSNRKDEAMLILTGSFIEGVYLTSKIQDKNKDKKLMQLIGEQKLFLENILSILPQYKDKKEMSELIAQLTDLKMTYDKVTITYRAETDPNKKNMEPISITGEVLKQINEKITAIRNSIIQPKGIS